MPPDNNQTAQRSVHGNQIPPIGRVETLYLLEGTRDTGYALRSATPLFNEILEVEWDPCFQDFIEGEQRHVLNVLVDGIYPRWTIFAAPHHYPKNSLDRTYTTKQEAVRKISNNFLEFYRVVSFGLVLRTSFGNAMRSWKRVGLASYCIM
jgi:hypothetical protein